MIGNGADINTKDKKGKTPLHHVVENFGRAEVAEFLIKKGAGINVRDNDGKTPLFYAKKYRPEMIELLLRHGATE